MDEAGSSSNTIDNLIPLPTGWTFTQFGDIIEKMSNGLTSTQNKEREGIPVTRIETISAGVIDFNRVGFLSNIDTENIEKYRLHQGDILFSHINSDLHLGKTAIFQFEQRTLLHGMNLLLLRPAKQVISPRFLNFLCNHYRNRGVFISIAQHAVNQSSINQKKLKNIPLYLPPLPEQHRIVTKIEELLTQLDAGVASLKKAQAQLKRYRQAVLKAAFEGRLTQKWREEHKGEIEPGEVLQQRIVDSQQKRNNGKSKNLDNSEPDKNLEIPEEWIMTRIHNIAPDIQYGSSEKADDNSKGIPIIRMGNLQDGKIDFSNLKYISRKSPDVMKCLLHQGDVLFNRTNSAELVGKTAVFRKESYESVFASYLIRVRPDDELYSSEFLSHYINSAFGRSYISSVVSQQVGQANVNGTKLANMPIPYPHVSEQKRIIEEIERHFSQIDHLEQTITTSLRQAESLRQSILKRAFEGKLVPQDPDDEPASILLERIKAEKALHAAETKKGKTLQPKPSKRKIKNGN